MTESRTRILDRLRQSGIAKRTEPEIGVRAFDWDQVECVDRFERQLRAVRAEVLRVDQHWPEQLATYLNESGVKNLRFGPEGRLAKELVAGWPANGPELVRHSQPIEDCREALFAETDAAFTSARAGIAETGSLVLWPDPAEPRLLSLVPPIHCVLIEADRIRSTLHGLMVDEGWSNGLPTNVLLISGPSKSADIEQTLAYGVHGPARLVVMIRS